MECFFGRLKAEMFHGERFRSADEPVSCREAYIRYWNDDRLSLALDGMPPLPLPGPPGRRLLFYRADRTHFEPLLARVGKQVAQTSTDAVSV